MTTILYYTRKRQTCLERIPTGRSRWTVRAPPRAPASYDAAAPALLVLESWPPLLLRLHPSWCVLCCGRNSSASALSVSVSLSHLSLLSLSHSSFFFRYIYVYTSYTHSRICISLSRSAQQRQLAITFVALAGSLSLDRALSLQHTLSVYSSAGFAESKRTALFVCVLALCPPRAARGQPAANERERERTSAAAAAR